MNTDPHPHAQLSAYLDGALAPEDRTAVEGHVATCGECRDRLGELRATAALIGALPDPVPSRRLVPRVAAPPAWLAPLRTLSTLASAVSVFLFIATALLANIGSLATSTSGGLPAAAPAAAGSTSSESSRTSLSATSTPSVNQGPATAGPTALGVADSAKAAATVTPAPPAAQLSGSSSAPQDAAARSDQTAPRETVKAPTPPLGTSPYLWLSLALVTGAIAIALQRRLRSA